MIDPNAPVKYFAKMGWIKVVKAEEPLRNAAKVMVENGIRHLPVVEGENLVGFMSIKDVMEVIGSYNAKDLLKKEVYNFMSKKVIAAAAEDPLWEVLKAMAEADVGAVPLLDNEGKVIGIFTERDVVLNVAPELEWEGEAMKYATKNPKVVERGTPLADALDIMNELKVRHLPVVEDAKNKGPALGILTALNVVDYALRHENKLPEALEEVSADEVMSTLSYVVENAEMREAVQALGMSPTDALLLLGDDKVVKGIITDRDVMMATARYVERLAMP
ncbi:CBS domain-containing protein [Ignicoccus hospitalis]|uniref:Putative signal transduction protein with CBS domains n=1 Tax=Ignicoccus hospitalis (strain KIN4/I / DSM 18386 / JCM 14125) TaxID=453591 RepID=A8AA78_IGNH4|nr:CBS domain-containing protein [Ignicoccus hospitalis]ABU81830.1 putative signal transduction protein with CBS domains [Ignicoccus hospitalis KIN4/I]HIH90099.1 CBS domain-containing protein [Desulfurococcaceae archaeon]